LALDRVNGARDIHSCAINTGWRFLAGDSTQGAATHVGSVEGASPKLTGFSSEPEIADAIGQLSELASIPQVQNGAFKLRFLRVPWLRFEAFWLHGNAEDLVIPCTSFAAAPEVGLEMMQPYTATAFLNNIRQALSILNEATAKRAQRQVQRDVNQATAKQIQIALALEERHARELVSHRHSKGAFSQFEDIPESIRESLKDKRDKMGFGPRLKRMGAYKP
jgi:hypothetical protein